MTQDSVDLVSELVQSRCGVKTSATLEDGRVIAIYNIAWGRDMGEAFDHVTTNISPAPTCPHTVDFFSTDEVALLLAPESGAVLYRKSKREA